MVRSSCNSFFRKRLYLLYQLNDGKALSRPDIVNTLAFFKHKVDGGRNVFYIEKFAISPTFIVQRHRCSRFHAVFDTREDLRRILPWAKSVARTNFDRLSAQIWICVFV